MNIQTIAPSWTPERAGTLLRLWAEGLSASQIAKRLGNVTRSAVLGKLHRLGASRRPEPTRVLKRDAIRRIRRAQPKAQPIPEPEPDRWLLHCLPPVDPTLTLTRLNAFTCRYPIGDPQDPTFTFCGRTCDVERPYCPSHKLLCYQPDAPKAKVARLARYAERTDRYRMARADIAL